MNTDLLKQPLVKEHRHKETANVILPGEQEMLTYHVRERSREGVRMDVNFLGEANLSEAVAGAGAPLSLATLVGALVVLALRLAGIYWKISLPLFKNQ